MTPQLPEPAAARSAAPAATASPAHLPTEGRGVLHRLADRAGLTPAAATLLGLLLLLLLLAVLSVVGLMRLSEARAEATAARRERGRVVEIARQILAADPGRSRPGEPLTVEPGTLFPPEAGVRTRFELLAERQGLPPAALRSVDVSGDGVRIVLEGVTSQQVAAWLEEAPNATADTPNRPGRPPLRVTSLLLNPQPGTAAAEPTPPTRWTLDLTLEEPS